MSADMFTLAYTLDGRQYRHPLPVGDTVVGRAPVCDLAIDDPSISRRHAQIRVLGEHCHLADLGGRNGTFVNGVAVTEAEVAEGDSIILGRFQLRLEKTVRVNVQLSDQHSLIESPGTLYRRIDDPSATAARSAVDAERLLQLLTEISHRLVKWQPLEDILSQVIDVVFETVKVERAFLMLLDDAPGGAVQVVPRIARGRDGKTIEGATISRTVVERAVGDRVAILASDAWLDPRLAAAASLLNANVRSFICAPLWNQNAVIGVLYVDNPRSQQLAAADLDIMQALASYAAVAIEQTRLTARLVEETSRRERLQRYHSSAVVDRIMRETGGVDAPFVADEKDVTALFADIVGFTTRSEYLRPAQIAAMLNRVLGAMCEAVFAEEGTLDKFIGDAIFAVFGAPLDQPDHAARAVRAAAAMRRAAAALDLDPRIQLRIALNSGPATVGDIGTPARREFTVLGDVVNTCSRLVTYHCQPGQIVMSQWTASRLSSRDALRSLGTTRVRGREGDVEVLELISN
jgi:adenylate cyclase